MPSVTDVVIIKQRLGNSYAWQKQSMFSRFLLQHSVDFEFMYIPKIFLS